MALVPCTANGDFSAIRAASLNPSTTASALVGSTVDTNPCFNASSAPNMRAV